MIGMLFRLVILVAALAAGWIGGSLYPAPPWVLQRVNESATVQRLRGDLQAIDWRGLRERLSEQDYQAMRAQAMATARQAGDLIEVEHVDATDVQEMARGAYTLAPSVASAPAGGDGGSSAPAPAPTPIAFETTLALCPGMTVTNAPPNANGHISNFAPVVNVQGVALAVNPTHGACLSSGFGGRDGRQHKGVDYHSATGGPIMAAGDGVIVEMKYRDDYGNMLLIDHGHGVYTRYAHLSSFQGGLEVGSRVTAGQVIGLMGNTASYAIPIHLHYEVLLGDYNTPAQSFGLTPHSVFEYRAPT